MAIIRRVEKKQGFILFIVVNSIGVIFSVKDRYLSCDL